MSWLSPAALWLGLAALPLIAAYLHQRRKIVRQVPSLVILGALAGDALPPRRRLARPHPWLSLLLCLAALGALVFALAQPTAPDQKPRRTVVVLDTSASMGATTEAGQTRFAEAGAIASQLAAAMVEGDDIVLVEAGERARVRLAATDDPTALAPHLADLAPFGRSAALGQALLLADALCVADGRVVVLTDDPAAVDPSLLGSQCALHVPTLPEAVPNVGISAFAAAPLDALGMHEIWVEAQSGAAETRTVNIALEVAGETVDVVALELPPGELRGTLVKRALPARAETLRARIVHDDGAVDGLAADDEAWAALPRTEPVTVRLVTSTPDGFVAEALRLHPAAELEVVHPDALATATSRTQLLVVEDDLPGASLPPADFVAALGTRPEAVGLDLVGPTTAPDILRWSFEHPLLALVELDRVRVDFAHVVALPDAASDAASLVDVAEGSLAVVGPWRDGERLWLGFAPARSDIVLRVSFVHFVANLIEWSDGDAEAVSAIPLALGEPMPGADAALRLERAGTSLADPTTPLERAGVYDLFDGETLVARGVANLVSAESDVRGSAVPEGIETALPTPRPDPRHARGWLLVAAFALLLVEVGSTWRRTRGGRGTGTDAVAPLATRTHAPAPTALQQEVSS